MIEMIAAQMMARQSAIDDEMRRALRQPLVLGDVAVSFSEIDPHGYHVSGIDENGKHRDIEVIDGSPKIETIDGIDVATVYKSRGGGYYAKQEAEEI